MSDPVFTQKVLSFAFSGSQNGSFTAAGLRAAANIQRYSGKLGVQGKVKIWGLSDNQMNNYSTKIPSAIAREIPNARLIVQAGDLGGQLSTVIDGPIWSSNVDLADSPESAFSVSVAGIFAAANPNGAQSWQGPRNAEDLITALCAGAFTVTNNGAHAVLRNPTVAADSIINQAQELADAAGFQTVWGIGNTLSIYPMGGTVDSVVVPMSPSTGMVSYPQWWELGIIVRSLFNQEIQVGRQMNVSGSVLSKANGLWQIVNVQDDLTTMISKGPWFTTAVLAAPGSET